MQLDQEVLRVLSNLKIDGCKISITEQLERKTYLAVNEVLERLGGKWNRKAKAHIFEHDPTDLIDAVIVSGSIGARPKTSYFPTPVGLVRKMRGIAELDPGLSILEPSAGQGHIADYLPRDNLTLIEILPENRLALEKKGYHVVADDFLKFNEQKFDRIIMNPPFERQADIDHVQHAFSMLVDGGVLVSIMSAGVTFRDNRKTVDFRKNILEKYAELVEPNPDGAFTESGTEVRSIMIKLAKRGLN